ncbi:hypothetical protein [Bacillus thuringiensis]|uniref:hypothetical protein n=1 Tax=Bacillus thuringiensis TaxID=1428 RepID=UPI000BFBBFEC|nr:hypothetical protein [Bacillus thuringiensis]PGM50841.1 hypothetical protein CN949_16250 [Bacillus thuringiensis]
MLTRDITLRGTLKEIGLAVDNLKTIENVIKVGSAMRRGGEKDFFVVVTIEDKDANPHQDHYADGE